MQVHQLLLRGMLAGLVAALLAFGFARVVGEPGVERAIGFESALHETEAAEVAKAGHPVAAEEPEMFSRATQAGPGLFTAVIVVGTAIGGLFALLFAFGYGRVSALSPKVFAAVLGLICFVAVSLVPALKYPANPPAVGEAATIGMRTGLYFSMIAISVIATVAALSLRRLLAERLGSWNATLAGAAAFAVLIAVASLALPAVNEVPEGFPAHVLWQFRLASLGIQVILWCGTGLLFGALTERAVAARPRPAARG